tara:strand:+ start:769 stop:1437 length:669 start_codon:yes stop_codon:yes gene_type:complete
MKYTIFLVFIILFFLIKNKDKNIFESLTGHIEALTNNIDIVLLGDSMLENSNYVDKDKTVSSSIKKTHKKNLVLAKDESKIDDIQLQLKQIPDKLNNKNTYVFLSIGGNDLLYTYKYQKNHVNRLFYVDSLFKKYKQMVIEIKKKYKFKLVLLNIYYPESHYYSRFQKVIKKWNNKLFKFVRKNKIQMLDVTNLLYKKKHFIDGIEPSISGSEILAKSITSY